jgi:hypothetical protein
MSWDLTDVFRIFNTSAHLRWIVRAGESVLGSSQTTFAGMKNLINLATLQ